MKEATGELNMTVVTIVAVAAVGAFFYAILWPSIQKKLENNSKCANAVCACSGVTTCNCSYITDSGQSSTVMCAVKNT